jgi:hypothetical protein
MNRATNLEAELAAEQGSDEPEDRRTLDAKLIGAAATGRATMEDMDGEDEDVVSNEPGAVLPSWALTALPSDVKLPDGWLVWTVRLRAKLTNTPGKGDRTCVMWNLDEGDEKRAMKRAKGDHLRVVHECTKQMLRVVDGAAANWSGMPGAGSVDQFWKEIGGKCRQQLMTIYLKQHTMDEEDLTDFFEHCVAVRTAG